jgi:hypothetical protein
MRNIADDDTIFETIIGIDGRPARVLKDGARLRIPLTMRDAALADRRKVITRYDPKGREEGYWEQEEEEAHDAMRDGARCGAGFLHDGRGGVPGHRPGYLVRADISNDQRRRAHDAYRHDLENAWRNPPTKLFPPETIRRDAEAYSERDIGGVCTVKNEEYPDAFGSPGHIRRVGRKIICVPDKPSDHPDPASDRRTVADEYRLYDLRKSQEWKNPT